MGGDGRDGSGSGGLAGPGAEGADAEGVPRLRGRGRLPPGHLRSGLRVLQGARAVLASHPRRRGGQDGHGQADDLRDHHVGSEHGQARPFQGDLEDAVAGQGDHRRPGQGARRRRTRRGLHRRRAARLRVRAGPAEPAARLRHGRGRRRPDPRHPRQRHSHPDVRQPGRHGHAGRVVPPQRRDAVRGEPDAVAVPQVRRPRQQSRLLHGQHARDPAHQPGRQRGVVPRGALQPAPDGPVPLENLDSPRRRAADPVRPPAAGAVAEPVRHRDGHFVRSRGEDRRNFAHGVRQLVPGLCHAGRGQPQHRLAAHRDGPLPLRHAPLLHARRVPRIVPRSDHLDLLPEPVEGRLVAVARRGRGTA